MKMKQQLELATTKCGSLQQELEMIKDKVRKSSSQSAIKVEESNDEPEIEESDKNSISGDFPMGSEFDNEVRKFFLEMPDGNSESRRPLSASSDSSDVKSTKSKQDIINIFFKRLETMENKEENSEPSYESKLTYDIDNSSFIEDEFEDVGEFFSSIQNEENEEKETKSNIENLKIKYKEDEKDKIETSIKKSLSKIKLTKTKPSKNLKNNQKKKIKHVVPVNDVINYMKKNTKREKMTKSIRSGNRKEIDFIKKNLIMNPKLKKSKSTVSAPLIGQKNVRKISNGILPTENNVEKIPPPPPPPPPPQKKPKVEPDKKIELQKKSKIEPEKTKIEQEKTKIEQVKTKIEQEKTKIEQEKTKIEINKKPKIQIDKKPELVSSLVAKLNNVKKHQEQRSLITIPEKKLPKKVEDKIEQKKTQPKILNDRKNESKTKMEIKVEEKIEVEKKPLPMTLNGRRNESKVKIESKLPEKVQNNSNLKINESKMKNEVVKKVTLFESKNFQKQDSKIEAKIDRKVSNMKEIFKPKIDEKLKGVQSFHSKVGSTLMQKMSKTTFNGENTIKSLALPSLKKDKNFERFSKIPFIVGQSTTKSYHIGLNIQQTLSLFKLTPSLTSLCDNETKLERSPAFTILVPERKMKKACAACVNPQESDEEETNDPWSITEKLQSDQRSRQFSQCSCLPGKLMSFHEVLSQMFQPENTKMFNNYQTEEDSAESQKSCATYRENNAFHHLKLLRKIQKLQETFEKS